MGSTKCSVPDQFHPIARILPDTKLWCRIMADAAAAADFTAADATTDNEVQIKQRRMEVHQVWKALSPRRGPERPQSAVSGWLPAAVHSVPAGASTAPRWPCSSAAARAVWCRGARRLGRAVRADVPSRCQRQAVSCPAAPAGSRLAPPLARVVPALAPPRSSM
jgi:hypothetical protein